MLCKVVSVKFQDIETCYAEAAAQTSACNGACTVHPLDHSSTGEISDVVNQKCYCTYSHEISPSRLQVGAVINTIWGRNMMSFTIIASTFHDPEISRILLFIA